MMKKLLIAAAVFCTAGLTLQAQQTEVDAKQHIAQAALCYENTDYADALKSYQAALKIRQELLGEDHMDVARCYSHVGVMYEKLKDYPNALTCHQKTLAICRKVLGEEHAETAVAYNNVGVASLLLGKQAEAETNFQAALKIRLKIAGEEHAGTAVCYDHLGMTYLAKGDFKKAHELCGKALTIRQKALGENHADTARSYFHTAEIYEKQKNLEDAEKFYNKSNAIFEKVLKKTDPLLEENIKRLHSIESRKSESVSLAELFLAFEGVRKKSDRLGKDLEKVGKGALSVAPDQRKKEKVTLDTSNPELFKIRESRF